MMILIQFLWDGLCLFASIMDAIPSLVWLTVGTGLVVSFLVYAVLVPPKPVNRALTQPDQFFLATQYFPERRVPDESDFHLLLICNPMSGNGQGLRLCELVVQPMLQVANVRYELIVTESGSHAYELASELDPNDYSGIAVVGGDSVLHEVINGLFHQSKCDLSDFDALLARLPVAIIPTGGGNEGLAYSIGDNNAYVATKRMIESICQEQYRKLDLYAVDRVYTSSVGSPRTPSTSSSILSSPATVPVIDFHLSNWGLLSDLELSMERSFRAFPRSIRFYLAIMKCLLDHRPKIGSLTLKVSPPLPTELAGRGLPEPEPKIVSLQGGFSMVSVTNVSHWKKEAIMDPDARPDDGRLSVVCIRHCSRWNFLRTLVAMETGSHVSLPWVATYRCTEVLLVNETGEVNICGYGEAELDPKASKADSLRFRSSVVKANVMC
jgi:diacylglycerol kinase family enzyme